MFHRSSFSSSVNVHSHTHACFRTARHCYRRIIHRPCRSHSNVRRTLRTCAKLKANSLQKLTLGIVPVAAALILSGSPVAEAADLASVGTCLLRNCQSALAQCLGDANCLKNVVCLNSCQGRPDETACQIRCGDLYEDQSVDVFNSCAVSDKKCVPERVTEGLYPVPTDCAIDNSFRPADFEGRWFITAGYNELFDIFDCQVHYFASPSPDKLLAKINWRIPKPDGDFIERSTMQSFVQDASKPGVLYNHGNEYLHYEDDWYIVKSKKDSYFFVYYKGNNDAWKGYGGAVVYTRSPTLPTELIPELKEAAASVGLEWDKFTATNNTCPPHPPRRTIKQELQEDVKGIEATLEKDVRALEQNFEGSLISFGRGFTVVENDVLRELSSEEKLLSDEFKMAPKVFAKLEAEFAKEFGLEETKEETSQVWLYLAGLTAFAVSAGAVAAQQLRKPVKLDSKTPASSKPVTAKPVSKRVKESSVAKRK